MAWTATLAFDLRLPKQEREDRLVAWIRAELERRGIKPDEVDFLGMVHGPSEVSARVPGPVEMAISSHYQAVGDDFFAYPVQRLSLADEKAPGLDKVAHAFRVSGRRRALVCWYGAEEFELRMVTASA